MEFNSAFKGLIYAELYIWCGCVVEGAVRRLVLYNKIAFRENLLGYEVACGDS
jgi:hypothetical protein